jgi:hypothetical protein
MMSLSHSGSIHVVTKDARFSRGLPSSISSSLMIWYAASRGIDRSGIRYLQASTPDQHTAHAGHHHQQGRQRTAAAPARIWSARHGTARHRGMRSRT